MNDRNTSPPGIGPQIERKRGDFEALYRQALTAYIEDESHEGPLVDALLLGRAALGGGPDLLGLLAIHHALAFPLITQTLDMIGMGRRQARAEEFLAQVVAPFEMTRLGLNEILGRLRRTNEELELRVAERTKALTDLNQQLQREVEERKKIAESLRQSTALLGAIIESSAAAIASETLDGMVTSWNLGAEEMFGYSAEEMIGQPISVIASPDRPTEMSDLLERIGAGERLGRIETDARHRDGKLIRIALAVSPIYDATGLIIGASKIAYDITERQRTERQMQELQAELVHVSRLSAMGQMGAALAHELNQPLTAIVNYMQAGRRMIETGGGGAPRLGEVMEKAAQQASRAGQIIRRLRQFVEQGATDQRIEDVNQVVEEGCALALVGAHESGVKVTLDLAQGLPPVVIDRVQIQQVILNLVRNALEAMSMTDDRLLVITTTANGDDTIEIGVKDSGPGISPEILRQLFQPFTTTKEKGMGIGLSICRSIVEAHGGRIAAGPNMPCGTHFRFTIPAAPMGASHAG